MSQKYKITNVREPKNALEKQRAKDSKDFSRTSIKLVASSWSEVLGGALMVYAMQMDSYAPIATAFGATLMLVSAHVTGRAVGKLDKLYHKKRNRKFKVKMKKKI